MICPKCENDCGDNKFCGKCGTALFKKCYFCGKEYPVDNMYCPNCGKDNSEEVVSKQVKIKEEKKKKNKNILKYVITIFLTIIALLLILQTSMMLSEKAYSDKKNTYKISLKVIGISSNIKTGEYILEAIEKKGTMYCNVYDSQMNKQIGEICNMIQYHLEGGLSSGKGLFNNGKDPYKDIGKVIDTSTIEITKATPNQDKDSYSFTVKVSKYYSPFWTSNYRTPLLVTNNGKSFSREKGFTDISFSYSSFPTIIPNVYILWY